MYAIVDIAGQQFKVEENQEIYVHRLNGEKDSKVSFDTVLLIDNKGKVSVGDPIIKGASISARILEHLKGDKIIVFKKKRRKGYRKTQGHRQYLTKIHIEKIAESGARKQSVAPVSKKESTKPEGKTIEVTKANVKKSPDKEKTKTAKKTVVKKAVAKKPAAKKTTAKKPTAKKKS